MNLIVNADKNWGIGKNNELLVHIPNDMKMFRNTTIGKVVVNGQENSGKLSKRTASGETDQYCYDEKQRLRCEGRCDCPQQRRTSGRIKKISQRRYLCHRGRKYLPYAFAILQYGLRHKDRLRL